MLYGRRWPLSSSPKLASYPGRNWPSANPTVSKNMLAVIRARTAIALLANTIERPQLAASLFFDSNRQRASLFEGPRR